MNKVVAALAFLILVGCSRGDVPTKGQHFKSAGGAQAATATPAFGLIATKSAPGTAYEARIRGQRAFARLPDRGELLSYPRRDASQNTMMHGAYTWQRVDLSEEHALRAIVSGHMRVRTPSGEVLDVRYDRHVEHESGDLSWIGHIEGQPGMQTIITFGADAVYGSIGQPGKRSLRLTTRSGAGWIVQTDPAKLVGIASTGANPRAPDTMAIPKTRKDTVGTAPTQASATATVASTAAATTTIDLLAGYTQGFAAANGGASGVTTRLNYLVTVGNQALSNSQVNARIRLVRAMQVTYTDTSANESALEQLTGYDASANDYTTPNAAFNALRAARETYGADLVTLVRDFRDPEQGGCGIAWLIGGGRSGVSTGDGQDYFGYSIVSDGQDENGADTYFCRDETLIHELAHNAGSQHDREAAEGGDGSLDADDYGAYAYSFGLKAAASAGNFYTVMAYGDQGQIDYRVFSNPRITFCGGRACGTTTYEDNARSIGQIMPVVATFRSMRMGATNDYNGDGRSDVLWRNAARGMNTIWPSANSSLYQRLTDVTGTAWKVAGIGDFNGDGRSDILWRNTADGRNSIWLSGNSATRQSISSVTDVAWAVAGIGDFNRDGRSDILWRNAARGMNTIWPSANSSLYQRLTDVTGTAWKVAGIGDFNGDGRSDILWRNTTDGRNSIWLSGNSATRQSISSVTDLAWSVAG